MEDEILEFRCELQSSGPETLARLRARLAVRWEEGFSLPVVGTVPLPGFEEPKFKLIRVEDLDFAVAVDGRKVFDVSETVPKQEEYSLLVPDGSGGRARIVNIVYAMKTSVRNMARVRPR